MAIIKAPNRVAAIVGYGYFRPLNEEEAANPGPFGPVVTGNDRQFDLWRSMALSGVTIGSTAAQLNEAVAKLSGIARADVDEVALAAALAEHIDGVDAEQVEAAMRRVLERSRITAA